MQSKPLEVLGNGQIINIHKAEIAMCFAIVTEQPRNYYEYFKILADTQRTLPRAPGRPRACGWPSRLQAITYVAETAPSIATNNQSWKKIRNFYHEIGMFPNKYIQILCKYIHFHSCTRVKDVKT
jgi:hypothetical protein